MSEFVKEVEERFNRLMPCSHKEAFEQGVILGLEHGMSALERAQKQIEARSTTSCCALDCLAKGFDHCKGREYDEHPERETFALPEEPEEIEPTYDDGLRDNGSFIGV